MEMYPEEQPREKRKPQDMHAIEPEKRLTSNFGASPDERRKVGTEVRHRSKHIRSDDGGPICLLIPGQKISCKPEGKGQDKQQSAGYPVKFSRVFVRTCKENP